MPRLKGKVMHQPVEDVSTLVTALWFLRRATDNKHHISRLTLMREPAGLSLYICTPVLGRRGVGRRQSEFPDVHRLSKLRLFKQNLDSDFERRISVLT